MSVAPWDRYGYMSATLYRTTVRGSYPENTPKIRNYRTTPQRPCWLAAGEILEISNFPEILENWSFPVIFQNFTSVHTLAGSTQAKFWKLRLFRNFWKIRTFRLFSKISLVYIPRLARRRRNFGNFDRKIRILRLFSVYFTCVHTQAGSPQANFWKY